MDPETLKYNDRLAPNHKELRDLLAEEIDRNLPGSENRIWHAHPVWFLDDNPTVGYSKQKPGIRLMIWSDADFEETGLNMLGKRFKGASVFYNDVAEVKVSGLRRWIRKAQMIQWDCKGLAKRKGRLERLK